MDGPLEWEFDYDAFRTVLKILDMITMAYFCAEYIVRFICAPKKKTFFFAVSSKLHIPSTINI